MEAMSTSEAIYNIDSLGRFHVAKIESLKKEDGLFGHPPLFML